MLRKIILVLPLCALLGLPAVADEGLSGNDWATSSPAHTKPWFGVFLGYAAYKAGQHDRAIAIWSELAEVGNVRAETNLANMYEEGKGVARDPAAAAALYRRAAEAGDSLGQYHLGRMLLGGAGIERNLSVAKRWLEAAAKQGDADAERLLASIQRPSL